MSTLHTNTGDSLFSPHMIELRRLEQVQSQQHLAAVVTDVMLQNMEHTFEDIVQRIADTVDNTDVIHSTDSSTPNTLKRLLHSSTPDNNKRHKHADSDTCTAHTTQQQVTQQQQLQLQLQTHAQQLQALFTTVASLQQSIEHLSTQRKSTAAKQRKRG